MSLSLAMLDIRPKPAPRFSAECRPFAVGPQAWCSWTGRSGRRHVATIYPFDSCPDIENAVAFAVRRHADGTRDILLGRDLGPLPMVVLGGEAFREARREGANEIHLHLLAPDATARTRLVADCCGEA